MDFTRLFEILEYQQKRYPNPKALSRRAQNTWQSYSTDDLLRERDRLSAGLMEIGLHAGDRVGVLAHCGSPEWVIADGAMLQIGIIPVPIHATSRPDEIAHIARDAGLKACFVSEENMLSRLRTSGADISTFISFEKIDGARHWTEVACDPGEHEKGRIEYFRGGIGEDDLATLLYTSGTTGLPKGVMLSHRNIVSNVKSVLAIIPVGPDTRAVSFLPLSHIFERMVLYTYIASGVPVWFADAVEKLPKILPEVRPHFFTAVPRVLERMRERLLEERSQGGPLKKKVMDWAIALGERYPYTGGRNMPPDYFFKRLLADFLVYRHWRKRMGGQIRYIAVGAAALQPALGRLFSAAGIEVREGYGLTETSPVIAFNRFEPGGVHFGTVGPAAPGVEVRISDEKDENGDGEIEVFGHNIMKGYLNLPEETATRFTADGWFRTGDVGHFVHKRFLRITGRKSEIFKTTSGKFVAPAYVEQQLSTSPFVSQCMALGANKPHVAALIVPDFVQLEAWCAENDVHWTSPPYMVLNPKVQKLFRREIEQINETLLGPIEKIKGFHLVADAWTAENGLLTPTLKIRRDVLAKQFEGEIKGMFG